MLLVAKPPISPLIIPLYQPNKADSDQLLSDTENAASVAAIGAQPNDIDELGREVLAEVRREKESDEKKEETIVKPVAIHR